GLGGGGRGDDLVRERLELVVLGDEVGLGVDLDHHAVLGHDQALGGGALGALAHVLGALDAQQLDGLVEIALGLDQRVLTIHHSGAGELTEPLHVGSGVVRHRWRASSLVVESVVLGGKTTLPTAPVAEGSARCAGSAGRLRSRPGSAPQGPPRPQRPRPGRPRRSRRPGSPGPAAPAPTRPAARPRPPRAWRRRRPDPRGPARPRPPRRRRPWSAARRNGWRRRYPGSGSRPGRDRSWCPGSR